MKPKMILEHNVPSGEYSNDVLFFKVAMLNNARVFICSGDFRMVAIKGKNIVGWLLAETSNLPEDENDYNLLDPKGLLNDF